MFIYIYIIMPCFDHRTLIWVCETAGFATRRRQDTPQVWWGNVDVDQGNPGARLLTPCPKT